MFLYSTVSTLKPAGRFKHFDDAAPALRLRTDGGDGCYNFAELELVKDGGLTRGVETDHKDTAVLLAHELTKSLAENSHVSLPAGTAGRMLLSPYAAVTCYESAVCTLARTTQVERRN